MFVLPTAYLPPMDYFRELGDASIEVWENFPKRTLRNRAKLTKPGMGNGQVPMTPQQRNTTEEILLTVPVEKANSKQLTRDVRIAYQLNWQQQHWHTIEALYRHTPYFLYYEDFLRPFYEKKYEFLLDWNNELNDTIFRLLHNERPSQTTATPKTTSAWQGEQHFEWEENESILRTLFLLGPENNL